MWEEDPKWQEAQFRFLVGGVGILTLLATAAAILWRDWTFLAYWFSGLAVVVGAVSLYAAAVWVVGHSVRIIFRIVRHILHRGGRDA